MDVKKTIIEKIWEQHIVRSHTGEPDLLYIDLHLVHEVTSPQAFEALRLADRPVRRPDLTLATVRLCRKMQRNLVYLFGIFLIRDRGWYILLHLSMV